MLPSTAIGTTTAGSVAGDYLPVAARGAWTTFDSARSALTGCIVAFAARLRPVGGREGRSQVGTAGAVGRSGATGLPAPRPLPEWLTANRVKGHTRLRLASWGDEPEFMKAAAGFKALGARVFTRHVHSGDEEPWPSAVWKHVIDEAHAEGLRIIGYYWHMSEAAIAAANVAWRCKEPDRATDVESDRGISLDITGPFRDVVLDRLFTLAKLGIDGFMFDERHLPPPGCWGSPLEKAWTAERGTPAPPPNDADEFYRQFVDFKARAIEDTFVYWRDRVQARHPHVVFVVSTTTIPALTDREMTTRLARVADSAKNEYRLALNKNLNKGVFEEHPEVAPDDHARQAVGWTVLRDAADGRPPSIWVSGVPDVHHAHAAAGSLLTFGCIANMDVDERSLLRRKEPEPGKTPLDALEAAFELGRVASPHLAAAQPVRWAAIHFAERARNALEDKYRAAWEEVLWPLVGAFQALSEDGLPVGVVNDHQLQRGELAGYRLLVLPDPAKLTTAQEQAVAAFAAGGGAVLENDPAWRWADPAGRTGAFAAFREAIAKYVPSAPVHVTGGPAGRYAIPYRSGSRLVVAVTNDFSWVQITNRRQVPTQINEPPRAATSVRVEWRRGHGLPEQIDGLPFPPLRAVEAVGRATLPVQRIAGGYRVDLPPIRFMALLVVSRRFRRPPAEPSDGLEPSTSS